MKTTIDSVITTNRLLLERRKTPLYSIIFRGALYMLPPFVLSHFVIQLFIHSTDIYQAPCTRHSSKLTLSVQTVPDKLVNSYCPATLHTVHSQLPHDEHNRKPLGPCPSFVASFQFNEKMPGLNPLFNSLSPSRQSSEQMT